MGIFHQVDSVKISDGAALCRDAVLLTGTEAVFLRLVQILFYKRHRYPTIIFYSELVDAKGERV